jgi:hypothetical protein
VVRPAPAQRRPAAAASNFAYAKQATSGAQFRIAEDEALVVTADPMGAAYFGFQIADPWGSAPDYANHTASLNAAQARANDDGTVTFVVALRDPQVHNWVDTVGLEEGTLLIRWQALPAGGIDPRRSIRQVALVKLSDVAQVLPKGAHRVSADDRRHQLAARKGRLCAPPRRGLKPYRQQRGQQMPALNCEQMIAEAERATGLADWGGDDFREPLAGSDDGAERRGRASRRGRAHREPPSARRALRPPSHGRRPQALPRHRQREDRRAGVRHRPATGGNDLPAQPPDAGPEQPRARDLGNHVSVASAGARDLA